MNPEGVNLTDFWTDTSPNRLAKFKVRPGVNELQLMIPERAILISESDLVTSFLIPLEEEGRHIRRQRSFTGTGLGSSFMTRPT